MSKQPSTPDGGSAFPRTPEDYDDIRQAAERIGGMSLRDYFAGQALGNAAVHNANEIAVANLCYLLADAMLKARGE